MSVIVLIDGGFYSHDGPCGHSHDSEHGTAQGVDGLGGFGGSLGACPDFVLLEGTCIPEDEQTGG